MGFRKLCYPFLCLSLLLGAPLLKADPGDAPAPASVTAPAPATQPPPPVSLPSPSSAPTPPSGPVGKEQVTPYSVVKEKTFPNYKIEIQQRMTIAKFPRVESMKMSITPK